MRNRIPPPLVMVLTGAVMWLVAEIPISAQMPIPYREILRTLVFVVGLTIVLLAMYQFARVRTTVDPIDLSASSHLATGGVYRISRNPMYLGLTVMLVAWGIQLASPFSMFWIAVFIWYLTMFQIKHEEAALHGLFGEEYDAYCRRVRRWL